LPGRQSRAADTEPGHRWRRTGFGPGPGGDAGAGRLRRWIARGGAEARWLVRGAGQHPLPEVAVIRVALADDHAIVRAGFRLILETEPDIEVVGEASEGREAVRLAALEGPDGFLMDVQMPGTNGLEATRLIAEKAPDVRVLILTTFERDDYVFGALRNGAAGFLLKNSPPEDVIDAVRTVAGGDSLLAPSVTRRIIEEFVRNGGTPVPSPHLDSLTDRERQVLVQVGRGLSNREIAEALFVGEATIKSHVSAILTKLGLRDRVQAVVFAYEAGLILPGIDR